MSGHHNFDHTVQQGNLWVRKVAERLHFEDHRHAYSALRASLHALRDRPSPADAVHLAAQLGETAKVIDRFPLPLKELWPKIARRS